MSIAVGVPLKSALRKPGTPKKSTPVNFCGQVALIGVGTTIPLCEEKKKKDEIELDFEVDSRKSFKTNTYRGKTPSFLKDSSKSSKNKKDSSESNIIEAYLKVLKLTGIKATWMRRYITLTSSAIFCLKAPDAGSFLQKIDLAEVEVQTHSSMEGVTDSKNCVEILYGKRQSLVLKCGDAKTMQLWESSIQQAVEDLKNQKEDKDDAEDAEDADLEDEEEFIDEDELVDLPPVKSQSEKLMSESWWGADEEEMMDLPPIEDEPPKPFVKKEKATEEPLQRDKAEKERLQKEKAEKERLQKEKADQERLQKEKADHEKAEKERLQRDKVEQERLQKEKADRDKVEQERLQRDKVDQERLQKEKADQERLQKEKADQERLQRDKADRDKVEQERLQKEKADQERLQKEKAEKERLQKEKVDQERLQKEKTDREKADQERLQREKQPNLPSVAVKTSPVAADASKVATPSTGTTATTKNVPSYSTFRGVSSVASSSSSPRNFSVPQKTSVSSKPATPAAVSTPATLAAVSTPATHVVVSTPAPDQLSVSMSGSAVSTTAPSSSGSSSDIMQKEANRLDRILNKPKYSTIQSKSVSASSTPRSGTAISTLGSKSTPATSSSASSTPRAATESLIPSAVNEPVKVSTTESPRDALIRSESKPKIGMVASRLSAFEVPGTTGTAPRGAMVKSKSELPHASVVPSSGSSSFVTPSTGSKLSFSSTQKKT